MKKINLLISVLILCASFSTAQTEELFVKDGIKYQIVDATEKTVEVTTEFGEPGEPADPVYAGELVIPASVSYNEETYTVVGIGGAFSNCPNLLTLTLPTSITGLSSFGFMGSFNLSAIHIVGEGGSYSSVDGVVFNADSTSLVIFPPGKSGAYTIPNSITTIPWGAFSRCSKLNHITIPETVTNIENMAFASCTGLAKITLKHDTPLVIDEYDFQGIFQGVSISDCVLEVPVGKKQLIRLIPIGANLLPS